MVIKPFESLSGFLGYLRDASQASTYLCYVMGIRNAPNIALFHNSYVTYLSELDWLPEFRLSDASFRDYRLVSFETE